ncbi:MAG TPA: Ig-like domain-containing protein [Acidobacteriota bacterium]|nr:Ig-like domain-containing protein [Acidobacteriota bacterium]
MSRRIPPFAVRLTWLLALLLAAPFLWAQSADLDNDGDVDRDDILIILMALNEPAMAMDPRDLDNDGTITILDARKAVIQCDRNLCATEDQQPPQIDLNGPPPDTGTGFAATFTENGGPVSVADSDATVEDNDMSQLESATVTIRTLFDAADEVLAADTTGTSIAAAYNPATGVLTLTGPDSVANFQQVVRTVTYDNLSDTPDTTTRNIDFQVMGPAAGEVSNTATTVVTVVSVNDDPVVDLNGGAAGVDFAATFTEGDGPVSIVDPTATVTDSDNSTLVSASVTITNPQDGASEVLAVSGCPVGLTVTPGLNSLDISGMQPLADYQTCLASVTYDNMASPATLSPARLVEFVVDDPDGGTGSATSTVTVLEPAQGMINIVKDTVPDDPQDFAFSTTGGLTPSNFSLDDDADGTLPNTQSFMVDAGSYTVTEAAAAGFDLTALDCVDSDGGGTASSGDPGTGVATINLEAGETVTCTFTNTKRGTISIVKDTVPDDPQDFDYTATGGLSPSNFSLDDDADGTLSNTQTFLDIVPGSYTVSEAAAAGFDLTSLSCVDSDGGGTASSGDPGTGVATINLDAGETVTCTFTNTKLGTINIVKDTVPDDPQDFDYTATGGLSPSNFSLDDDADGMLSNTQTFNNVAPGGYTVSEAATAGFDLTALDCVDSDGGGTASSGDPATGVATINLDAGETVTCTFTNTKLGTINIVKDTVPDDAQDFDYTATGGLSPSNFSLDDDADGMLSNTQTFNDVSPGAYTVTEAAAPAGFFLSEIDCTDSDAGGTASSGDPGTGVATINLEAGETVTCTFTNVATEPPTAVDDTVAGASSPGDTYHTALNTPLAVPDGADDLLNNDTLGTPEAALVSFGGGDAGGTVDSNAAGGTANFGTGSLQVNADGSFDFTPDNNFTGLFTFDYKIENVAGSSTATVTLAVGFRPVAVADSRTATGNVSIDTSTIPFSVLSNDTGDLISFTAIDAASTNGGQVAHLGSGQFSYNPPPGFEGNDTFDYSMGNGFGNVSATVTVTVSDMIWFVDATAMCPCDGRLSNPFNELAGAGGSAFDTNAADDPGDNIFLADGSYTGGLTLLASQRLIGDGSTGTLAGLTGITLAPGSASLPTFSGTDPTITTTNVNALTLGSNNTVRGLTIGNTGTGTGIIGNFGTLVVREATISGTGQALDLSNGTLDAIFDAVSSTSGTHGVDLDTVSGSIDMNGGALSGSTSSAFVVNNSSATVEYNGTITNTSGRSVDVQGSTSTVTFTALINDDGSGVFLNNNTNGTINFQGGMNLDTGANTAFTATGGGTVNATGVNTIGSAGTPITGQAVNIANTTIGAGDVTFRSVFVNGGTTAINLNTTGTMGSFIITGVDGPCGNTAMAKDCDGGIIQNTTGNSIVLNSTSAPSFSNLRVTGSGANGISGTSVTGFTLNDCDITMNGDAVNEGGLRFDANLLGTATISNSLISGSAEHNIEIVNNTGVLTLLTISGSEIADNSAALGADGLLLETQGTAQATVSVSNSRFDDNQSDGIQISAIGSSSASLTVIDSTFTSSLEASPGGSVAARAIVLSAFTNADLTFDIGGPGDANTFTNFSPNIGEEAINVALGSTSTTSSITNGKIRNNTFTNSGGAVGIDVRGDGLLRMLIDANIANTTARQAIDIITGDAVGDAADVDLTITNNDLTVSGTAANPNNEAIAFLGDRDTNSCLNVRGNTGVASGTREDIAIEDFTTASGTVRLESGATDCGGSPCADGEAHLLANNTITDAFTDPLVLVAPGTCDTPP